MNTQRTLAMVLGACTLIACSQCGGQTDAPNRNGAPPSSIAADAGSDAAAIDATIDADAAPSTEQWLPVPGLEMCDGHSLNLAVSTWPTRTWTSCGPGCLTAPAAHIPGQISGDRFHSGAATMHGDTYLRTVMFGETENFQELRRASDDAVLFVLRFQQGCYLSGIQSGAPFLFEVFRNLVPDDGVVDHWVARFQLETMGLAVHPAIMPLGGSSWMAWDHGWGVISAGAVRLALDPNDATLTTVYQGVEQYYGQAHGEMVAWIDWGVWPTPIRSYTAAGGQKILIQGNWGGVGLSVGDERIAWIAVQGLDAYSGKYDSARLAWAPYTSNPDEIQVTEGPSLTGRMTGQAIIDSVGDYIALTVGGDAGTGAGPGTYVTQISTGKFWFIPARTETFVFLAAMSKTEIIVMERAVNADASSFKSYLRYDLSKLDELGQQVTP